MKIAMIAVHNNVFWEMMKTCPEKLIGPIAAHATWLEEKKAAGKYLGGYYLPGDGRDISLWEFEKEGEVDRVILEDPLGFGFDFEVHPAISVLEHIQNALAGKA